MSDSTLLMNNSLYSYFSSVKSLRMDSNFHLPKVLLRAKLNGNNDLWLMAPNLNLNLGLVVNREKIAFLAPQELIFFYLTNVLSCLNLRISYRTFRKNLLIKFEVDAKQ